MILAFLIPFLSFAAVEAKLSIQIDYDGASAKPSVIHPLDLRYLFLNRLPRKYIDPELSHEDFEYFRTLINSALYGVPAQTRFDLNLQVKTSQEKNMIFTGHITAQQLDDVTGEIVALSSQIEKDAEADAREREFFAVYGEQIEIAARKYGFTDPLAEENRARLHRALKNEKVHAYLSRKTNLAYQNGEYLKSLAIRLVAHRILQNIVEKRLLLPKRSPQIEPFAPAPDLAIFPEEFIAQGQKSPETFVLGVIEEIKKVTSGNLVLRQ